ncbi:MAG TPA: glycosyltransferase family 9 protein [Pyrinomonadaceae bacterium]|jgi:heptosyltransferase III|nr:glycosyltransferase family 9 protein [Pyrinomonadaceae bacterium]
MNSLRDIVAASPKLRGVETQARSESQGIDAPQPLAPARWDWSQVRKVLFVRLRSIGDTVLATSAVNALRRFLPDAQIDILVEDWVAPVLAEHPSLSSVISLERNSLAARARIAREIRASGYDVVYNLHGGTTSTFLTRASGARHRVGYESYQYAKLHNHQAPSASFLWGQEKTHSVEQQLALLGWTGVPVTDRPATQLAITQTATFVIQERLRDSKLEGKRLALIHPAAAFATKQWAAENFARVVEYLERADFSSVAIVGPGQDKVLDELQRHCSAPITTFNLSLPEVSALASRAELFVGNDSGIAHMAAAVGTPSVVIFGSSNIAHWRPWSRAESEVVFEEMPCQPCHGYFCEQFEQPECILRVPVNRVTAAIERVLTT